MARISSGKQTAYNMALQASSKRKAIVQHGMDRSNAMRNSMTSHINNVASAQVQTAEQSLRAKSAAAAKVQMAKLNKLA